MRSAHRWCKVSLTGAKKEKSANAKGLKGVKISKAKHVIFSTLIFTLTIEKDSFLSSNLHL